MGGPRKPALRQRMGSGKLMRAVLLDHPLPSREICPRGGREKLGYDVQPPREAVFLSHSLRPSAALPRSPKLELGARFYTPTMPIKGGRQVMDSTVSLRRDVLKS